jgi:hypothetical protein
MPNAGSHLRLLAALLTTTAAAGLTTAAPAAAQAVATATPATAGGKPTKLMWAVDGTVPPVAGRIPKALVMTAPGFTLDRRAIAKRCRKAQATLDECPKRSKIGTALMTILVTRPNGTVNPLGIEITLYQGSKTTVFAVIFLVGNRVVPGKLESTADGIALTFDPLPIPPAIPQVSYAFKDVSANLGVTRKVIKRVKGNGRKRRKRRTVRYSLVRTPADCAAGSWAATATLTFADTTSALLPASIACTAP